MSAAPRPYHPPRLRRGFVAARRTVLEALGSEAADSPLAVVGRELGVPVCLLGVDPPDIPEASDERWCVRLAAADGTPLLLRIDDALVAAAVAALAESDPSTVPPGGVGERALAGVIAAQALRCLAALAAVGRPCELVDVQRTGAAWQLDPGRELVLLRLVVGAAVGRVAVDIAPQPPAPAGGGAVAAWVEAIPVEVAAVVAWGRVRRGELDALAPGDAVTFDEAAEEGAAWLQAGPGRGGPRWPCRALAGDRWEIVGAAVRGGATGRRTMSATEGGSDRTEVQIDRGVLDDVPVEVVAVAGRAMMTIRDLSALGPGAVVGLGRRVGWPVELVANGVPFARGRLVDLDGELAVEVRELGAGTPAAPLSRS